MKRTTKSILTVLFTLAMLMSFIPASAFATEAATTPTVAPTAAATDASVAPTGAAATSWKAFVMYAAEEKESNWAVFTDNGYNSTDFLGDGVYTLDLKATDAGATGAPATPQVFLVDIPGFAAAMEDAGKNINNYTDSGAGAPHDPAKHNQPTDLTIGVKVYVDGQKITCKNDKINYGNIEEKGTFRIELYNIWGLHAAAIVNDPPVNSLAICPAEEIKVVFTIQGTGFNTDAGAQAIADYEASFITPTVAAPAATDTASSDTAATDTTSADTSDSNNNTPIIIAAVAVLVVIIIVIIVVVTRKKK